MTSVSWKGPAAGLAALVVGTLAIGLVPPMVRAQVLEDQIDAARAELAKPNSGPEVLVDLENDLAQLREIAGEGMTPIPADADIAGLMGRLSTMFDMCGLGAREVTTGQAEQLEEASSMPMSVAVQGRFPAILRVLIEIESLDRLVRIERLRLTGLHERKGPIDRSGDIRASVQLDVFFAPRAIASPSGGPTKWGGVR